MSAKRNGPGSSQKKATAGKSGGGKPKTERASHQGGGGVRSDHKPQGPGTALTRDAIHGRHVSIARVGALCRREATRTGFAIVKSMTRAYIDTVNRPWVGLVMLS